MVEWTKRNNGFVQTSKQGSSRVICFDPTKQKLASKNCPNVSDWTNDPVMVDLREILDPDAPPKYDLSQQACGGVLRGSDKRGRTDKLPQWFMTLLTAKSDGIATVGFIIDRKDFEAKIIAPTLTASNDPSRSPQSSEVTNRVMSVVAAQIANALMQSETVAVATHDQTPSRIVDDGHVFVTFHETGPGWWKESEHSGTLRAEGENRPSRPSHVVADLSLRRTIVEIEIGVRLRRLSVEECEILQGFPKSWTDVPHNGRRTSDSNRYKMLGNSWATNCVAYCGTRMDLILGGTIDASSAKLLLDDLFREDVEDEFFIFAK